MTAADTLTAAESLRFPDTWTASSCEVYQRLADIGRITQDDVDAAEAHLVWWREWRNYYATTGGQDVELKKASGE